MEIGHCHGSLNQCCGVLQTCQGTMYQCFAVADGPPGVAAAHLSSQEKGSEGVHTVSPERSAIIDKLQVLPCCLCKCGH